MTRRQPEEEQVARLASLLPWVRKRAAAMIAAEPERYADQLALALDRDRALQGRRFKKAVWAIVPVAASGVSVLLLGDPDNWERFGLMALVGLLALMLGLLIYVWLMTSLVYASLRFAGRQRCALRTLAALRDQRVLEYAVELIAMPFKQNRDLYPVVIELLDIRTFDPGATELSGTDIKALHRCLRLQHQRLVASIIGCLGMHGDESSLRPLAKQAERTDERGGSQELRALATEAIERIRVRFQERGACDTLPRAASHDAALLLPATPVSESTELLCPAPRAAVESEPNAAQAGYRKQR